MVAVVFFAQFGLIMYYIFELNGDADRSDEDDSPVRDAHHPDKVSMMKWIFAVALVMVAGDDNVGPKFGTVFWKDKWNKAFNGGCEDFLENEKNDRGCFFGMPPRLNILLRLCWDLAVNGFARSMICGTAPIMLCVEGPLDFVKDATAVFFIIKLDDIQQH